MSPTLPRFSSLLGLAFAAGLGVSSLAPIARADTVALWLFDEHTDVYPSSVLNDASHDWFLVLGRGGEIVPGKFGRALRVIPPPPFEVSIKNRKSQEEFTDAGAYEFGLSTPPKKPGRTVEPMTWFNATFTAAFVNGDEHLRRAPFPNPTKAELNLGRSDFTVEFWLKLDVGDTAEGVVIEIGTGPRGENDVATRLSLLPQSGEFSLFNEPSRTHVRLKTNVEALRKDWAHCAFTYDAQRGEVRHYLDGRLVASAPAKLLALPEGKEDYLSIGRDGRWGRPLFGGLDEMRISDAVVYRENFTPRSFSARNAVPRPAPTLVKGPPLLFLGGKPAAPIVELGDRKHLFIDDAMIARSENVSFVGHPARIEETVLPQGTGWTSVVQDEQGLIRLYGEGKGGVCVWTSKDGVHFEAPKLPGRGDNCVAPSPARRATVILDPNGPPEERWKMFSGSPDRGGFFVYTSADGWSFKRNEMVALDFWAGSASIFYYDDQRQVYTAHHRMDYGRTEGGKNYRFSLRTDVQDVMDAWPFEPVTEARKAEFRKIMRIGDEVLDPWWLDNGPLSPGGFSIEYPIAMGPDLKIDPIATDLYNTRAVKYPWAPDTYVAFPLWYYHYDGDGPAARRALGAPEMDLGSGLVEVQLAVSRDGIAWKRYPRPAYVPVGDFKGFPMRRPYVAAGLVRRGNEIWQYVYTRSTYHSPHREIKDPKIPDSVVQRLSQRLDGFVSLDAPYEKSGSFTTQLLRFQGKKLVLNVDAGATGEMQIGFEDEQGRPVPGFGVDDCVYINGNFVEWTVSWLKPDGTLTQDVSALAGKPVRLVARLRGASLYALQFMP